jgi:hypothetical protein
VTGGCECPLLRAAAEVNQLLEFGLEMDTWNQAAGLLVGSLRERYGCRGPIYGRCRWDTGFAPKVMPRKDVPLLYGSNKPTGQYL